MAIHCSVGEQLKTRIVIIILYTTPGWQEIFQTPSPGALILEKSSIPLDIEHKYN
jgi:hypothetical protein